MKIYKFRDCYLNTIERQVTKNGEVLRLTPKTFDVLHLLVEKCGEIVTKDELLGKVWNGNFVEEGNLAVHISRLRDQLGQTKIERYIETVPGAGYRFVSSVELADHQKLSEFNVEKPNGTGAGFKIDGIDPHSYRLYLKAKYLLEKRAVASVKDAIKYLKNSLSYDPTNPLSYAGLIECYISLYCVDHITHFEAQSEIAPVIDAATAMAQHIDQLQVAFAEASWYLHWDFVAAENQLRLALELNPASLKAHYRYTDLLICTGRVPEALKELGKLMHLDPISVITCKRIGRMFTRMGRYEEALRFLRDAVELDPIDYEARAILGTALFGLGNYDEALSEFERALEYQQDVDVIGTMACALALRGDRDKAYEIIRQITALSNDERRYAIKLARIYTTLGKTDLAFYFLERAYEHHDFDLSNMTSDPRFRLISNDSRFIEIARRVGIILAEA
jgi:DNA-binding winged helix-turn-helix (wHTH) protein/tetratricopeptide (TPR) repeat protein